MAVGGPATAPGPYTLTVDEPPTTGSRRSRTLAGATPTAAPAPPRATAAPAKPTGLSATASHDQVVLTWDDPQDASITGYVILRRVRENNTGGKFRVLVADTGSAATTYTDATVSANTTYTYRIKAINAHGASERSRWFHIDIPAAPERPDKPRGLSATASHDQVVLTWDDPGDASITGYVILRRVRENDTGGAFGVLVADTGSAATTYSDDTVSAETTYTYRIKAINEYGVSQRSRWFHIDIPAAPQATFVEGDDPDGEGDGGGAPGHATPPGPGKRANVSEPDGEDLPNDTTTTGEVDVGGSVTGNINPADDYDYFRVYLYGGRNYQIDVEGADTNKGTLEDPWLSAIYNADNEEILDTFSSVGELTFKPIATGTYYISVVAEKDTDTGTYTLSVREVPPTRFEEKEGVNRITDIPANGETLAWVDVDRFGARGTIGVSGDIDWFFVVLEAGRTYRIDVKGAILTGPGTYADNELTLRLPEIVAIYDEDSTYLHHTSSRDATDDANRPHHLARVEFTPNAGGLHFIAATGVSFERGGYELTVIDVTDDADAHTANRSTTGTVDVGGSIQGKIDFSGDRDWFEVELDADTEYTFDLEGQATGRGSLRDPYLRGIYDADGNEIPGTRDDDGGEGNNARVTFTPEEAGIYYVAAAAFGYLEGTYMLSAGEVDGM